VVTEHRKIDLHQIPDSTRHVRGMIFDTWLSAISVVWLLILLAGTLYLIFHETRNRCPGHETFSMEHRNHSIGTTSAGTAERMTSMADLAMVLLGLFSVSIFLAHAIQAYRAQ